MMVLKFQELLFLNGKGAKYYLLNGVMRCNWGLLGELFEAPLREVSVPRPSCSPPKGPFIVEVPSNIYQCGACKSAFINHREFQKHTLIHECKFLFKCTSCERMFNSTHAVLVHRIHCKGEAPPRRDPSNFVCSVCHCPFGSSRGLGQHERHRHPEVRNRKRIEQREKEIRRKREARYQASNRFSHLQDELLDVSSGGSVERQIDRSKIWSDNEVTLLKELDAKFKGAKHINIKIAESLRSKSNKQISDKRRQLGLTGSVRPSTKPAARRTTTSSSCVQPSTLAPLATKLRSSIDHLSEADNDSSIQPLISLLDGDSLEFSNWSSSFSDKHKVKSTNNESRNKRRKKRVNLSNRRKKSSKAAADYRYVQDLYQKNRKRLASEVLDGKTDSSCPVAIDKIEETYRERFGSADDVEEPDLSAYPPPSEPCHNDILLQPITNEEIQRALFSFARDTAVGPDGLTVDDVIKIFSKDYSLFSLFNGWLFTGKIPDSYKSNRSILIPKGCDNLDDLGNWRPITMSSVIVRLYLKILAARLSSSVKLNPRQRGFIDAAGCLENVTILDSITRSCKREGKYLGVALLDLAKAFDTISHKHILTSLKRFGVSDHFVGLVSDLYTNATTYFKTPLGQTGDINILKGVKQGDPLSPILFNIAMDALFAELTNARGNGFTYSNVEIPALAYADDTALISSSHRGLQRSLNIVTKYCDLTGLRLNVNKCVAYKLTPLSTKSFTVNEGAEWYINTSKVPWLNVTDCTKYLGRYFCPWTRSYNPEDLAKLLTQLGKWCNAIQNASLKPRQKLYFLKTYVIPRIKYKLFMAGPPASALNTIDSFIRTRVKFWLHLPDCVNNDFLYTSCRNGGLGLPSLRFEYITHEIQRRQVCLKSSDNVISQLARLFHLHTEVSNLLESNGIADKPKGVKNKWWRHRALHKWEKLPSQGKGVSTFSRNSRHNFWINGDSWLSEKEFIAALQVRTNTYPTREACSRGRPGSNVLCRHCNRSTETLGHITGYCPLFTDNRIARHNRIVKKLIEQAKGLGYTILEEPRLQVQGRFYKPDIVIFKDNESYIIDPTVIWDSSPNILKREFTKKRDKYLCLIPHIKRLTGCDSCHVVPVVLGARGSWSSDNSFVEKILELSNNFIKDLCLRTLTGTLKILNIFMNI